MGSFSDAGPIVDQSCKGLVKLLQDITFERATTIKFVVCEIL